MPLAESLSYSESLVACNHSSLKVSISTLFITALSSLSKNKGNKGIGPDRPKLETFNALIMRTSQVRNQGQWCVTCEEQSRESSITHRISVEKTAHFSVGNAALATAAAQARQQGPWPMMVMVTPRIETALPLTSPIITTFPRVLVPGGPPSLSVRCGRPQASST